MVALLVLLAFVSGLVIASGGPNTRLDDPNIA